MGYDGKYKKHNQIILVIVSIVIIGIILWLVF
jgi:hypothetical protein